MWELLPSPERVERPTSIRRHAGEVARNLGSLASAPWLKCFSALTPGAKIGYDVPIQ